VRIDREPVREPHLSRPFGERFLKNILQKINTVVG
jgi:hypothetical protein